MYTYIHKAAREYMRSLLLYVVHNSYADCIRLYDTYVTGVEEIPAY